VLHTQGASKFFFAAGIGRLGISMTGLGILWLVQHYTGSFASAGMVTGAFAISEALMGPQIARHMDQRGQTRLLPPLLLAHSLAAAALLASLVLDTPFIGTCLAAVAAGASVPQLGALSAARWSHLLDGPRLTAAFSLEAVANDVAFLAGPAVVGLLSAFVHPIAGFVCATALVVVGGLALAAQPGTAPPFGGHPLAKVFDRGIMVPAFFVLSAVNLGLGLFFGSMQLSVTAFTVEHAVPQLRGVLYGVMSVASLLGGLAYGAGRWKCPPGRLLLGIAVYFAAATALLVVADAVWFLGRTPGPGRCGDRSHDGAVLGTDRTENATADVDPGLHLDELRQRRRYRRRRCPVWTSHRLPGCRRRLHVRSDRRTNHRCDRCPRPKVPEIVTHASPSAGGV